MSWSRSPNGSTWYAELPGAVVIGVFLPVTFIALIDLWTTAGGDTSARVDLGGRWGEGTLGSAVASIGLIVVAFIVGEVMLIRSLWRRWTARARRRRR